jgi:serine/threonine protein kinase/WD40 repeat protein
MSSDDTRATDDRERDLAEDHAGKSDRDPLGSILESFLARLRAGERPPLTEYIARYPDLADRIRELLPALVEMERFGSLSAVMPGAGAPLVAAEPRPGQEETGATGAFVPGGGPAATGGGAGPWPERLGDYRILGCIGEGGMGVVYEAVRESLHSHVALKVMHPRYRASADYLRRFHNEARSAAQLHHTNIVSVFDYGEHDGVCYYAMQYIAGHSLDEILVDLRRLRMSQDPAKISPVEAAPAANEIGIPEQNHADRGAPGTEGVADPLLRAASHGLMTGQFALGATVTALGDAASPPPTEPIAPGAKARTAATHDLTFELGSGKTSVGGRAEVPEGSLSRRAGRHPQPARKAPSPPPAPNGDPNLPESTASHSSASLSSQGGDRYHREVARLGAQVADALGHAHKRGVLHRDIKPSNLLLDATGNVWVTDFGLAKFEEGEDLSRSQDMVGTLRYMAPERFRSVSDRRGDVYALGATLYELLTLHAPFQSNDRLRLIDQIANEPPAPPRQLDRRIPRDLETIVLKALAKDPNDRFASAEELGSELRRFVENRPIRSRPIPAYERLWRWCKRNPVIAGLGALAATLTILVAIVSTIAAYRNGRLAELVKAQRDEAKRNLIEAYASEAGARRVSRRVGQRFETLAAIERAMRLASEVGITEAQRLRLRKEATAAMALPDLQVAKELDVPRAKENGFAVDPDFERYAFKSHDGTVIIRRISDNTELLRLPGLPPAEYHTQARFSPDGRYLGMTSGGHDILQVWDLREQRLVLTHLEMTSANPNNWAFRPDCRELVIGCRDTSIVFYDLPSGRLLRRWTQQPVHHGSLAYSRDGSKLAIQDFPDSQVRVVASDSGRPLATLAHPASTFHVAWNPRRPNVLAVACEDNMIYVWDVETHRQTVVLKGDSYNGIIIAYHPGGEVLASRGWHHTLRLWDTRTGRMLLSQPSAWNSTLEFDRTGRWLSVDAVTEKARILEVADATECRTLVREQFHDNEGHYALALDPTGRWAVTTGVAVTVWDVPSGATLSTLPVTGNAHGVLFDASRAVLTENPALLRWPVTEAPNGVTTIGPPELLNSRGTTDRLAITPDGHMIASAMNNDGGLVFEPQNPRAGHWLRPHAEVATIAISPDSRWVVTGSHLPSEGMKLWDARTGRLVHDFPSVPNDCCEVWSFSPDGRWLATRWDGWVLFDTTTWTPKLRLYRGETGQGLAFASDSRTAVYDDNAGTMTLAEVETGRELARLEDPEQALVNQMALARDGSRLVATLVDRPYLRVWDLTAIRRRLAELRLDWDPPATFDTPEARGSFPAVPKPFRVDRGTLDSWRKQGAGQLAKWALESPHATPEDLNNLAWRMATGPAATRDPQQALVLARKAVASAPERAIHLNTLGVAEYRAGLFLEAVATLEKSLAASKGATDAFDLFFLAMAHFKLGQIAQARADLDRAVKWRRDHPNLTQPGWSDELDAFQAEAKALLGGPPAELPADVFAPQDH